ncbi:MAG: ABC transporter ATP-binding protein [Clostridiales bacterium]|nr:ABC transporter ATP-binding protein [Clostridiales bacterium]
MELIKCQDLTLGYDSSTVLSGLSFTVNEGDYLCILGENGSGKSTLIKTVLGLLSPLGGSIMFGEALKKNEIGYLPQQTEIQRDFPASVNEIVLSGCKCALFYTKENKREALENMEKAGISDLKSRCYRELSGGQQQRVLLARALCATKKLLLLDEPVTGLDPGAAERMYSVIDRLHKGGITVIMISHDTPGALKYASHILYIGKEIFFGTKQEFTAKGGCA